VNQDDLTPDEVELLPSDLLNQAIRAVEA